MLKLIKGINTAHENYKRRKNGKKPLRLADWQKLKSSITIDVRGRKNTHYQLKYVL